MASYKVRIGDYSAGAVQNTDYIEFASDGDPLPKFQQGVTNNYNPDGTLISKLYDVSMTLYYPGTGTPTSLWADWDNLNTILESNNNDIRIYYNNSLIKSYIKDGTDSSTQVKCFNSPRVSVVSAKEGKGQWSTYLELDLRFFIETDGDESNILNLDRKKTQTTQNGETVYRWSITARGDDAQMKVDDFRNGAARLGEITYEQKVQDVDGDTWSGTFEVRKGDRKLMELYETISVQGGGRAKDFELTLDDGSPKEFDGPRRFTTITIEGNIRATDKNYLLIPNRDSINGHEPDDEFSFGGSKQNTNQNYSEYNGKYKQVFKVATKENIGSIIAIKSLKDVLGGNTKPMTGDSGQVEGPAATTNDPWSASTGGGLDWQGTSGTPAGGVSIGVTNTVQIDGQDYQLRGEDI